ncbi:MAG: carboxypeptidase regulatory-like domain-containing protein [Pyrinomonadaceae bacterium]
MKSKSIQRAFVFTLTFFFSFAVAAQERADQTKDNAISGRVMTESGQPLSFVNVSLSAFGSSGGRHTTTDNEGLFRVEGLDAGLYRIFVSAPGYVVQIPNETSPTYRPGDRVELTLIKGGVIAGNITNINGEPVVNVTVRAYQTRDVDGNKIATPAFAQPKLTDDRGYYRIYGLHPGTYIVAAGGQGQSFGSVNPYANDAMTFAPSSTRDTAAEIVVRSDQEAGVDIRYRGEAGHAVSGKVSGAQALLPFNPNVRLVDVESHVVMSTASVTGTDRTFQLNGVSDGEYEISAIGGGGPANDIVASPPRRIAVRGADVTGLDLTMAVMASIDARINFEADAKLNCGRRRDTAIQETMVILRRVTLNEKSGAAKNKTTDPPDLSIFSATFFDAVPNEKGEIHFRNLSSATYRFDVHLPAAGWYLRDLTMDQKPGTKPEPGALRNGIVIRSGEKVSGIAIAIAEGGASLRGRVTAGEGQSFPPGLAVYLVPAEREQSDNSLRFFEAAISTAGTFAIGNIAPDRYWVLVQQMDPTTIKSVRTDGEFRAKLLREAESLKKEIVLKPCARTTEYEIPYSSPKP